MAFPIKIPYGLKELKALVSGDITGIVDGIKQWCNKTFSLTTHDHDNSYDAKGSASAVQTKLNTHVNDSVKHITAAERNTWNGKANKSHTHAMSDIVGLSAALAGKASSSHTHKLTDIVGGVVGYPNWSKFTDLEIDTQYTATCNGWLFYWIGAVPHNTKGTATLNINGHSVKIGYDTIYKYNYGNDCRSAVMYPIKKGDVYSVSVTNNKKIVDTLRFYECR